MKRNKNENQAGKRWFFSLLIVVVVGITTIGWKTHDIVGVIFLSVFFGIMLYGLSTLIDWKKENLKTICKYHGRKY